MREERERMFINITPQKLNLYLIILTFFGGLVWPGGLGVTALPLHSSYPHI